MGSVERDAVDDLLEILSLFPGEKPDFDALARLRAATEALRVEGRFFAAGYGLARGVHLVWGDTAAMDECVRQAFSDFEHAVAEPGDVFDAIAALTSWTTLVWGRYIEEQSAREADMVLDQLLAQRMIHLADAANAEQERCGYLIHGLHLSTDFRSGWQVEFPAEEVNRGLTRYTRDSVTLAIPSAFQLLVRAGDYQAAREVAERCPLAFTTFGLLGWQAAVAGFTEPEHAVKHFREAATHFAGDVEPTELPAGGWSSINIHLWAKYFQARAHVAEVIRTPERAAALIRRASESLSGTESGWVNPQVTCFRVVLGVLDSLFAGSHEEVTFKTRQELMLAARLSGVDESNRQSLHFLDEIATAYEELRVDPSKALVSGRLRDALETLGRIPLFGEDIANAVAPFVGDRAHSALQGQQFTWIYRTLERIADEDILRRVLLRLFQASVPYYAQVRHGPIEYGKDLAVLGNADGEARLTLYTVKAGDIAKRTWRDATQQLEEAFQVPLPEVQLPIEPATREVVLVFNGHLNTYVEPVAEGWLEEQVRDHGRRIRLMHLDEIVSWIVRDRLTTELRKALSELGVPIVDDQPG